MSRTKYLQHLERQQDAAKKIIDDLTRENYELRSMLKEAKHVTPPNNIRP